ncbi:NUDIX domain-containing protein [archaeon]|nr:NUDIX domain-containing protein [archaeon]MBL7057102.1 NUDIX domain-containing protein [Candidatus Woesearchaeota archaeon]
MVSNLAVKAFIVNSKEELFIVKRSSDDVQNPGLWELPGGRLNVDESPFDGLKREVKEECGLDIEVLNALSVQFYEQFDGKKITMINFVCKSLNKEVVLSNEHSEFEWIPLVKTKSKLCKYFHKEVDLYKKFFK